MINNSSPMIAFGRTAQGRAVSYGRPISYPKNTYAKPKVTVQPAITGTPTVGSVLTCSAGTWSPLGTISYQWTIGNTQTTTTTAAYTILAADVGKTAFCRVINTVGGQSQGVVARLYIPNVAPVNTVAPTIIGNTPAGNILSVNSTGTWTTGNVDGFRYQWQRNSVNVVGATLAQYKTSAADVGLPVRCVVTAFNADFSTAANSNAITVT